MDANEEQFLQRAISCLQMALAYSDGKKDNQKIQTQGFKLLSNILNFPQQQTQQQTLNNEISFKGHTEGGEDYLPHKLKYGKGTISKRTRATKKGAYQYWQARYYDGEKQISHTASTQMACINWLKEMDEPNKITKVPIHKLTFGEWLTKWYTVYKEPSIGKSSQDSYHYCIKLHISDTLKNMLLSKVTTIDVQTCLNKITATRQKDITKNIITAALRQAYFEKLTKNEGWLGVRHKKHKSKEKTILSPTDEPKLLALLPKHFADAVVGYLATGCRLNELLSVTEDDIDRNRKLLTIRGTKTSNALRTMPLLPAAATVLPLPKINPRHLQDAFKDARDKLGLTITIHDLRHTFTTRCREKGIAAKVLAKWLGHSTAAITENIYNHVTADFEQSETSKLFE